MKDDLKNWCYKNDVCWHTTTLDELNNKISLEKLWEEKEEEIEQLRKEIELYKLVKVTK